MCTADCRKRYSCGQASEAMSVGSTPLKRGSDSSGESVRVWRPLQPLLRQSSNVLRAGKQVRRLVEQNKAKRQLMGEMPG